jgi:hypothetical protein
MVEIVGGNRSGNGGMRVAVCSKSAAGTFKNLNQFAENSGSHKKTTSGSVS